MAMAIPAGLLQLLMLSLLSTRTTAERGTWKKSDGNYEYYASSPGVSKSYTDSLNECKNMDGVLATIKSQEIQNFLNTLFNSEGGLPYSFFIGLQQSASGSFVWDDGDSLNYDNWKEGEPNNPGLERCAAAGDKYTVETDLKWRDINCSTETKVGFFCQRLIGKIWTEWGSWSECVCPGMQQRERYCNDTGRSGPDACTLSGESTTQNRTCWSSECNITTIAVTTTPRPLGRGHWFPSGGFEYYVSPSGKGVSYQQSQANCRESDGELALVKSAEVHSFIASLVVDGSGFPYGFYIGLKHDAGKDGFIWTDGFALDYTNWHEGEPNRLTKTGEDCVGMGYNYEFENGLPWYDYECETGSTGKKGSVCQRRIGTYWGEWSEWSSCSCIIVSQSRNRTCLDSTRSGPNGCTGSNNETQSCPIDPSCSTTTSLQNEATTTVISVGSTSMQEPQTTTTSREEINMDKTKTSAIYSETITSTISTVESTAELTVTQSPQMTTTSEENLVITASPSVVSEVLTTTHVLGGTKENGAVSATISGLSTKNTPSLASVVQMSSSEYASYHTYEANETTSIESMTSPVKTVTPSFSAVTSFPATTVETHTTVEMTHTKYHTHEADHMMTTESTTSTVQTVTSSSHAVTSFHGTAEQGRSITSPTQTEMDVAATSHYSTSEITTTSQPDIEGSAGTNVFTSSFDVITTKPEDEKLTISTGGVEQSTAIVVKSTKDPIVPIVIGAIAGVVFLAIIIIISVAAIKRRKRTRGSMVVTEYGFELSRQTSDRRSLTEEERLQIIMGHFPGGAADGIGYGQVRGNVNQTFLMSDEDLENASIDSEKGNLQFTEQSGPSRDLISFATPEKSANNTTSLGAEKTGLQNGGSERNNDDVYAVVNKAKKSPRNKTYSENS